MKINKVASWSLLDDRGVLKGCMEQVPDDCCIFFANIEGMDSSGLNIFSDCMEPDFMCDTEDLIIENSDKMSRIFTRRKKILEKCDNAVLHPFGDCWLSPEPKHLWTDKEMSVSFTTTNKYREGVDGYTIRHQIVSNLNRVKDIGSLPFYYYASSRLPCYPEISDYVLGDKRDIMFRHAFHVAVENNRCDNFFTEKLMDCFISKTVPIYFGTNDIGDFFNTDGMLIFDTMGDLANILGNLDEGIYKSMKEAIEDNYHRAKQYCHENGFVERMARAIKGETNAT